MPFSSMINMESVVGGAGIRALIDDNGYLEVPGTYHEHAGPWQVRRMVLHLWNAGQGLLTIASQDSQMETERDGMRPMSRQIRA